MNLLKGILSFIAFGILYSCSDEVSDSIDNQQEFSLLKKTESQWNESDFYQVKSFQIGNLKKVEELNSFHLHKGLLIEEITEEVFQIANQKKYKYYLKDTLALIKKGKTIQIGKTNLSDQMSKNNGFEYYTYLGYFPVLNQYVVQGQYSDSLDFKMIDRNSGEIKQSFISLPIISKNANFALVCNTNDSEKLTYLEIYNYSNGFYKNAFKGVFTNWRILDFEESAFWGNEGSFYIKVDRMNFENLSEITYLKITLN